MRTIVLGALLVTSILIFGSAALAEDFPEFVDTIDGTPGAPECIVISEPPGEVLTATGGRVFVKFDKRRRLITGKCIITGFDELVDETFFDPNPTVAFPCTVILNKGGVGKVELDPACPDVVTTKRISKKGKVQLNCSGPVPMEGDQC